MAAQLLINEQRLLESIAGRKRSERNVQCYGGQTVLNVEDVVWRAAESCMFLSIPSEQIVMIRERTISIYKRPS